MFKRLKGSIAAKISLILVGMMLLCAITVGVSSIFLYRSDIIAANANRALAIAQATAVMIDGDEFSRIMETLEKDDYWYRTKAILDKTLGQTGIAYLYVLDGKYDDAMTYFAEGYDAAISEEEAIDLGERESLVDESGEEIYPDEMFAVLRDGTPRTTEVYNSGEYGFMVSGLAAIKNAAGQVVGVVGVDVSVNEVNDATGAFALQLVLIILAFCVVFALLCVRIMRNMIGKPLKLLTKETEKMADGDASTRLNIHRKDEIGILADAFDRMAEGTREQIAVLERLAQGDLTVQATLRGQDDAMGTALKMTLENLNDIFHEVRSDVEKVSQGSRQIANAAQDLAKGSTEQAAAVEEFSTSLDTVLEQSQTNATQAMNAYQDAQETGRMMGEGIESMNQLAGAMQQISESSRQIAKVIKVIDDIAFQTNILALNASVEAARAGQHGKGFAVVAEEVRNLASKSAQAASETAALIEDSVSKVTQGNRLVQQTNSALVSVMEIAGRSAATMQTVNELSGRQRGAISEITAGIGQISNVVQANSATAQQSAAASQEMSTQAQLLNAIVSRFQLKEDTGVPELPGRF